MKKNRANLGLAIEGSRERGAWAELYFMVMAMGQGLNVSSPYGGLRPYDVGVESGGRIVRIQVKCTRFEYEKDCYCMSINVKDGVRGRKGYAAGTVDFFAIYIIPTDDWYILPYELIGNRDANVAFQPVRKAEKYGVYREAWDLLVDACKGEGPLDIQACWEEVEGSHSFSRREIAEMLRGKKARPQHDTFPTQIVCPFDVTNTRREQ